MKCNVKHMNSYDPGMGKITSGPAFRTVRARC